MAFDFALDLQFKFPFKQRIGVNLDLIHLNFNTKREGANENAKDVNQNNNFNLALFELGAIISWLFVLERFCHEWWKRPGYTAHCGNECHNLANR